MDSSPRGVTPARQPELILASEADRRVGTSHSQRDTTTSFTSSANHRRSKTTLDQSDGLSDTKPFIHQQQGPTKTPDNTPRHPDDLSQNMAQIVTLIENEVSEGGQEVERILDDDEMFMTLTEEQRQEWETMMKGRTQQLDVSRNQHQEWSDSFTRRRMFVYSRMRKLQECYKNRAQFLTDMAESLSKTGRARARTSLAEHKKMLQKRLSEPQLGRHDSAHTQATIENQKPTHQKEAMADISEAVSTTNDAKLTRADESKTDDTVVTQGADTPTMRPVGDKPMSNKLNIGNGNATAKSADNETHFLHQDRANTPFVTVDQVNPVV